MNTSGLNKILEYTVCHQGSLTIVDFTDRACTSSRLLLLCLYIFKTSLLIRVYFPKTLLLVCACLSGRFHCICCTPFGKAEQNFDPQIIGKQYLDINTILLNSACTYRLMQDTSPSAWWWCCITAGHFAERAAAS